MNYQNLSELTPRIQKEHLFENELREYATTINSPCLITLHQVMSLGTLIVVFVYK